MRSRSNVRGESSSHTGSSVSRNKKRKELRRRTPPPPVPWIPVDLEGSYLEMERRPGRDEAGDGQAGSDGDGDDDGDESVCEKPMPDSSQSGACLHAHTLYYSIDRRSLSVFPTAELVPIPSSPVLPLLRRRKLFPCRKPTCRTR